jgi:hypothetical protein
VKGEGGIIPHLKIKNLITPRTKTKPEEINTSNTHKIE